MKKKTKIIIISLSILLVVIIAVAAVFLSGSTLFSDIFKENPKMQVEILEIQYKITKRPTVLRNLCDALSVEGNEDDSYEHHEKVARYCGLYIDGGNDLGRSGFAVYLLSLSKISETEKLKTEIEDYLRQDLSDSDLNMLYYVLVAIKQNGNQEEKEYVKTIAKRISDGSYLKSNSKTEYEELADKYFSLAQ